MTFSRSAAPGRLGKRRVDQAAAFLVLVLLGAACGGQPTLPPPRPLVVHSGARLSADPQRLEEINEWLIPQMENIHEDPSFMIESISGEQDTYPWETLVISNDTARYQYSRTNPDINTSYQLYAHFHLMQRMGRLADWLPEAQEADGYELERAIVQRMADSWLLGRAVFDTQPYGLLDELIYANEGGYLDAFLFTVRPDQFQEEREAWLAENPDGLEAYREWFRSTFNGEPPGIRTRASR